MTDAISRRNFLAGGAAAAGGALVTAGPAAAGHRPRRREVFVLNPDWNGAAYCDRSNPPGSCGGCHACQSHADNKVFADRAAADSNRAHLHCKCLVVSGGTVSSGTYTALFGPDQRRRRDSVDRRDRRVRAILRADAKRSAAAR